MTIWIHSTVNRNCLQDSEPLHPLPNRLFDAIYNVADIIVGYVWAGRETEAYLEESGFHVIGVGCGTCVNRLLVHWLPDRTSLDFLGEHEHAESLHILVRLTIGRRTIYGVNHTCSAAHCGLDDLLVGIFNQSKATTNPPKYQNSLESCIIPQITPKFERLIHLSPLQSTNNLHEIRYHVLGVLH